MHSSSSASDPSDSARTHSSADDFGRLQSVLIHTHLGFWEWDVATGDEWWSASMYSLLGYTSQDFKITYTKWIDDLVHADDRTQVKSAMQAHLENNANYQCRFRMLCKNGEYRWFESVGYALRNEQGDATRFIGTTVDVTEHHIYRDASSYREFLQREAARLAKIGIWELDTRNEKVLWSEEVYRIHEIASSETMNYERAAKCYVDEDFPRVIEAVSAAMKGEPFDFEARIVTATGNIRWVRATGEPIIDDDGSISLIRGVFQDITLQKQRELDALKQQALVEAHNERLINFSHIVSHNLRTHSGNLEMVLKLMKDASAQDLPTYNDMLEKISEKLSETIVHLNEITDIQNRQDLKIEDINLKTVFYNTLDTLKLNIEQSNARIEENLESVAVKGNNAYLESIFLNLLGNAIKYRQESIPLRIQVYSQIDNDKVRVYFEDNGLGIDLKRHRDKIFGLYNTFHRHPEAKGIGLFITRSQTEAMNGSINVESIPGKGSIFIVELPLSAVK